MRKPGNKKKLGSYKQYLDLISYLTLLDYIIGKMVVFEQFTLNHYKIINRINLSFKIIFIYLRTSS